MKNRKKMVETVAVLVRDFQRAGYDCLNIDFSEETITPCTMENRKPGVYVEISKIDAKNCKKTLFDLLLKYADSARGAL